MKHRVHDKIELLQLHHSRYHSARHVVTELTRPQSDGLYHLVCQSATYETRVHDIHVCRPSVYSTACGAAWSSRWLMTQLTNGERVCVLVHASSSGGHFEHTLLLSICFLCTWWTLCFTPCLMQRVIF